MATFPFSVLGYNTHLFGDSIPPGLIEYLRRLGIPVPILTYMDRERIRGMVTKLRSGEHDVIGLSEVWDDVLAFGFIANLKQTYPYSFRPNIPGDFPRLLGSGLVLLSKYPLQDQAFVGYTDLVGFDYFSHKGIAFAKVMVAPALETLLFVTHTQAGESDAERQARRANLEQLVSKIGEIQAKNPGAPTVLIGDLNVIAEDKSGRPTEEFEQATKVFGNAGLGDVFRKLHPDAAKDHGFTYDGVTNNLLPIFNPEETDAEQRLDYHFAPSAGSTIEPVTSTVIRGFTYDDHGTARDLSDHYPLACGFNLPMTRKG